MLTNKPEASDLPDVAVPLPRREVSPEHSVFFCKFPASPFKLRQPG